MTQEGLEPTETAEVHVLRSFAKSRLGKIVITTAIAVAAALASFFLAVVVEGECYEHGCPGTPGIIIANRLVPADQVHVFDAAARALQIEIEIDTPIWFVVICATGIIITFARRRHKRFKLKAKS